MDPEPGPRTFQREGKFPPHSLQGAHTFSHSHTFDPSDVGSLGVWRCWTGWMGMESGGPSVDAVTVDMRFVDTVTVRTVDRSLHSWKI